MLKKIPFLFATLTMIGGVFIAIMFGVNEKYFKDKITNDLKEHQFHELSIRDPKELKSEESKNWRYYQRFHFHATAIGAMSVAILILLQFVVAPIKLITTTSWLISLGGFLYPFVWLFAGIYGPVMGRHEAKETFKFFAFGGGAYLVGLIFLVFLIIKYPLKFKGSEA